MHQLHYLFEPTDNVSIERHVKTTDGIEVYDKSVGMLKNLDSLSGAELFCLNPIAGMRRLDSAVTLYRNWVLECDTVSPSVQLELLRPHLSDFRTVTHSGSKSLHCVISAADTFDVRYGTEEAIRLYKAVWQGLCDKYEALTGLTFDRSCKNPARLSRIPGATRMFAATSTNIATPDAAATTANIAAFSSTATPVEQRLINVGGLWTSADLKAIAVYPKSVAVPLNISAADIASLEHALTLTSAGRHIKDYLSAQVPRWAAPQNMRSIIFKYTCWMIDCTGCSNAAATAFLHKYTFPHLLNSGYPADKVQEPIDSAFQHMSK